MDGWGFICTNSVNMVLVCFYIRGWIRGRIGGTDQGMDHAYARDTELRRKPRTFYKVDKQIRLG